MFRIVSTKANFTHNVYYNCVCYTKIWNCIVYCSVINSVTPGRKCVVDLKPGNFILSAHLQLSLEVRRRFKRVGCNRNVVFDPRIARHPVRCYTFDRSSLASMAFNLKSTTSCDVFFFCFFFFSFFSRYYSTVRQRPLFLSSTHCYFGITNCKLFKKRKESKFSLLLHIGKETTFPGLNR